jgi:cysteine-S-conjugate beta-lyase
VSAKQGRGRSTMLVQTGRDPASHEGAVNPPVQRASTVILPDAASLYDDDRQTYGLEGMSAHRALREALVAIEGGVGAILLPSGLSACTTALQALTKAGDHVLVVDCCYGPTRRFCDGMLKRFGVETEYFAPDEGADIARRFKPNTAVVFLESPGSLTFEMQDIPAITAACRAAGIRTIVDATWAAGWWWKPFEHGIDVSVQAATKYQAGHSDVLLGACLAGDDMTMSLLEAANKDLGLGVAAEEAWLTLRGLRTMGIRLDRATETTWKVVTWLESRPEVARILWPPHPADPGHTLWKRDFTGASPLFGIVLKPTSTAKVEAFLDVLEVFGLGFSWGGYESLAIHCDPQLKRAATPRRLEGPLLRFSVGLEDAEDLIADLERGFAAL